MACRQAAANTMQSSQANDFGVLEQYLGFPIGDAANVNRSMLHKYFLLSTLSSGVHILCSVFYLH